MNEIIKELLGKLDVKQINGLLGKLTGGADGKLDMGIVKKLAEKLGADPGKLASLLPGILGKVKAEGGEAADRSLDTEKLLTSIDLKDILKLIPAAGAIKAAQEVSKIAAKKINEEIDKIREVESTLWKGNTTREIEAAADQAAGYVNTEIPEPVTNEVIDLLKAYCGLANSALEKAQERKQALINSGADKYSDPVAEMNSCIIKASQAKRALEAKLEEAEKKRGK